MKNPIRTLSILSPEECDELINNHHKFLTPAKVGKEGSRISHFARVCDNYKIRNDCRISAGLKIAASSVFNCPIGQLESVELIRYKKGGMYLPHHDGNHRKFTMSVYLNEGYRGGEILFTNWEMLISDIKKGTALVWENTKDSIHECKPILSKEKWLATIWSSA